MKPFSNSIMFYNLYGTELAHLKSKLQYMDRAEQLAIPLVTRTNQF